MRTEVEKFEEDSRYKLDYNTFFASKTKKINQGTFVDTGRNRAVSRNQTAILTGTLEV